MSRYVHRAAGLFRFALIAVPFAICGCTNRTPLDRAGISELNPPTSWKRVDSKRFLVPGTALASWTGPDGASLVVFRGLPAPRVNASGLLKEQTVRLENLPEMRIVNATTIKLAGIDAAKLTMVAPGTGDSLAATGLGKATPLEGKSLMPTRRTSLGIPREADTLWLVWHYPEAMESKFGPQIDDMIRGLAIHNPASSSY
ncbi:MAG: hypothetical protein JWN86_4218 [Planctomycetota bacterium]|nr:hypothetical protein [Planctomycetota bacterium]